MAVVLIPPITKNENKLWPTLGDAVAEWLEEWAVFGPGSKYGQPVVVDDEFYAWLRRVYQVHPKGSPLAGRRRFRRAARESAKGVGKSEWALWIAQAEMHPSAPVRTLVVDDEPQFEWRGSAWQPIGTGVRYPRCVFFAYTEEQVQRTAFGRFRDALKKSPLAGDYHITNERIVLLGEDGTSAGEAYPLAVSGDAADGDIPTWQHIDETHRWKTPRHREMHTTVLENQLKLVDADPWSLETTTAGKPGEQSVAEQTKDYAEAVADGRLRGDPTLFYFRRHAPVEMPSETPEQVEAIVREARGPAAAWSGDIPGIVARFFEPNVNRPYWFRVWGNQWRSQTDDAFDMTAWRAHGGAAPIEPGRLITAGFDGSSRRDSTALVICDVETGREQLVKSWDRPPNAPDEWEIDRSEVDAAVLGLAQTWRLWRLYADPYRWGPWIKAWQGELGEKVVISWDTNSRRKMAYAVRNFAKAIASGEVTHVDSALLEGADDLAVDAFTWHMGNAKKVDVPLWDEEGEQLFVIGKDRPGSPRKIDGSVAGVLAWEGRTDALAADALNEPMPNRVGGWW